MEEAVAKLYVLLVQYALNVCAALAIFVIGKWLARLVASLVEKALTHSRLDRTLAVFSKNVIYFSCLAFAVIAALNKIGVETNSFLAVIGAAGLAVGLAFQGALSNFAAGVMLVIFRPFRLDDYIQAGGAEGTVTDIQIFSTVLMTGDNKRIIIPNAKITSDKIVVFPK